MKFLIIFLIFVLVSQIKAQKEISADLYSSLGIYPQQTIESDVRPSRTTYAQGRRSEERRVGKEC